MDDKNTSLQEWLKANPGKGINDYYALGLDANADKQYPKLPIEKNGAIGSDQQLPSTDIYSLPFNIIDPTGFFQPNIKRKLQLRQCPFLPGATIDGSYYWLLSRHILFAPTESSFSVLSGRKTNVHSTIIEAAYLPVSRQLYEKYNNKRITRRKKLQTTGLLLFMLVPTLFILAVVVLPYFGTEMPTTISTPFSITFVVFLVIIGLAYLFFGTDKYDTENVDDVVSLPGELWNYGMPEGDFTNPKMNDFKEFLTKEELKVLLRERKLIGINWK